MNLLGIHTKQCHDGSYGAYLNKGGVWFYGDTKIEAIWNALKDLVAFRLGLTR